MRQCMRDAVIKIIIVILACCGALPAYAQNRHDYAAYLGLGLERTFFQGQNTGQQRVATLGNIALTPPQYAAFMTGESVVVGANLRCVGLEFGYTLFDSIYYPSMVFAVFNPVKVTGKQTGNNIFLDGILYYQFCYNFVAKLRLGAGYLTTKYTVTTNTNTNQVKNVFNDERFGFRAGLGLQWNFAKCWSTELGYVYQRGNDMQKNLQSIRLGINYYLLRFC